MKSLVMLSYQFMFDPSNTWAHVYEFEKTFSDFLVAHGFEAEIIKPAEGSNGGKVILISPLELVAPSTTVKESKKSPGEIADELRTKTPSKAELKFKGKK